MNSAGFFASAGKPQGNMRASKMFLPALALSLGLHALTDLRLRFFMAVLWGVYAIVL
jgi:hypothetical protein